VDDLEDEGTGEGSLVKFFEDVGIFSHFYW
jgi:hypothetical protein